MNQSSEPLRALAPRQRLPLLGRTANAALVARCLDVVAALCRRAIAVAWDEGRLAREDRAGHPYLKEVRALAGGGGGLASEEIDEAAQAVAAAKARWHELALSLAPRVSSLAAVSRELGLDDVEARILLLVAAPALRPRLARLYGILANDRNRPLCDASLIEEILGVDGVPTSEVRVRLAAGAPLVAQGAVQVHEPDGRPRCFADLSVDPHITSRLQGLRAQDVDESGVTARYASSLALDEMMIPGVLRARLHDDLGRVRGPVRLVVCGRAGSGRRTLLAALARRANRVLGVVDAPRLALTRGPDFLDALRTEIQKAYLRGWLPCVSGLDEVTSEEKPGLRAGLRGLLASLTLPVVFRVASDELLPLEPGYLKVVLPELSEHERVTCLERSLGRHGREARDLEALAARYRVGAGVIETAVARASTGTEGSDVSTALDEALRQAVETRLGPIAARVRHLAAWDQLVLPDDIRDSLAELVGRVKHGRLVHEAWGFERVSAPSRRLVALFQGGPGTGKTMAAGAIARELGLDLYRVDLSRVVSKWLGETEKNLGRLFDAAEEGNLMLLIDEADALFAKRTEVKSSNDRHANLEVNYLLTRLDSFSGIAVLTTNSGGSIDSAFARRLSFRLTFPFPEAEDRERLWRAHLPPELPMAGPIDLGGLAEKHRVAGGFIRNAALRAAFLCASEGVRFGVHHLERAVKLEYQQLGRIGEGGRIE